MKKVLFVVIAVSLIAAVAIAAPPTATGVWLNHSVDYQFRNCAATGSAAQVLPNGKYMVRVMENDVVLTFDVTYDGGTVNNRPMPQGLVFLESLFAADGGTPITCQSADGGGDVYFTATH